MRTLLLIIFFYTVPTLYAMPLRQRIKREKEKPASDHTHSHRVPASYLAPQDPFCGLELIIGNITALVAASATGARFYALQKENKLKLD